MAAVLPFDPDFRRRTPAADARRSARETPLSTRAVRAIAAPELIARQGAAPPRATPLPTRALRAVAARPAVDELALAREFFPLVLIVALVDLATKAFAVAGLGGAPLSLGGPFALHLIHNTGAAGGVWLGEQTRAINFMLTGIVVGLLVMLVPTLARLDRRSPIGVALVAGGGLGNLVSLGISSRGVPDFLALRTAHGWLAINVADVALAVGLVLLARTAMGLAQLVRRHGAHAPVASAGG